MIDGLIVAALVAASFLNKQALIILAGHLLCEWLKGDVTVTGAAGAKAYLTTQSAAPQYEPLWIQGGKLVATGKLTISSRLWG